MSYTVSEILARARKVIVSYDFNKADRKSRIISGLMKIGTITITDNDGDKIRVDSNLCNLHHRFDIEFKFNDTQIVIRSEVYTAVIYRNISDKWIIEYNMENFPWWFHEFIKCMRKYII